MLSRYRYAQLLWVVLFVYGLFVFSSERAEAEETLASWHGPDFDGSTTASGETFDADSLSTAHPSLPIGTDLIGSYGGKSVPVTAKSGVLSRVIGSWISLRARRNSWAL